MTHKQAIANARDIQRAHPRWLVSTERKGCASWRVIIRIGTGKSFVVEDASAAYRLTGY